MSSDVQLFLPVWALSLIFNFACQIIGFAVAFALQTERFFDLLGASNFILVAIASLLLSDDLQDPRRIVVTVLFVASRVWLLVFLTIRASDRGDARFDEIKTNCGAFFAFWLGQAVWVSMISWPVIAINTAKGTTPAFGIFSIICAVFFAVCLCTQAHSDWLKRSWVKDGRQGHFCRRGCWRWSRHPNYFGEIGMTVAAVGLALPLMYRNDEWSALALMSFLSPIFTFLILMFASGMPTAEGKALRRYYEKAPLEYETYRKETPILVPWPCNGYDLFPMALKRVLCCEWKMYELPEDDFPTSGSSSGNSPPAEQHMNGRQ
jgi:steroid 5-alpha reductase family enzyme